MKKFSALQRFTFFFIPFVMLSFASASETAFFIGAKLSGGLYGAPKASVFASDTVDRYGANWRALQIPLETGRQYEQNIEPFFEALVGGTYKDFSVYIYIGNSIINAPM